MSFSQFDEEEVLLSILPEKGRFLDIGASDGIFLSNTRALALKGWSGVLVEPSPLLFPKLIETYREREDIELINGAVSCESTMRKFYYEKEREWASSINEDIVKKGWVNVYATYWVRTISVWDITQFAPFDFISVDAEWEDCPIIYGLTNMIGLDHLKAICFELRNEEFVNRDHLNIATLEHHGFKEKHRTSANIIMAR